MTRPAYTNSHNFPTFGTLPPPDMPRCKCPRCCCPYCGRRFRRPAKTRQLVDRHLRREAIRDLLAMMAEAGVRSGNAMPPWLIDYADTLLGMRLGLTA